MAKLDPVEKTEDMMIGRKKAAKIITRRDGVKILEVTRTMKDVIRGRDNKMISHAMETDEACWPVESLLLSRMKNREIHLLVIRVRDTKALYISRLADWVDHSATYTRRKRNGSIQRILSFSHFSLKPGIIKL